MPMAYASAVLAAPLDEVWSYLRDFSNLAQWHPAISECEIEKGGADSVGSVRRLTMPDGTTFRERLLALSDVDHSVTYEFVDSPFPVRGQRGVYRVTAITGTGGTFAEWLVHFEAEAKSEETIKELFTQNVCAAGLAELGKRFG